MNQCTERVRCKAPSCSSVSIYVGEVMCWCMLTPSSLPSSIIAPASTVLQEHSHGNPFGVLMPIYVW